MPTDDELDRLARECDFETLKGSGPGGQHRNKTETAVRVRHRPTGLTVVATHSRSQYQNKRDALRRLWEKLKLRRQVKKHRVPTRQTRGSRERRLEAKKTRSAAKQRRRPPPDW